MPGTAGPPFVVAGEALVDVIVDAGGEPVESVGGSPVNVAVGLARLDVPTLLLTRVGDDRHGRRVLAHAGASGVRIADDAVTVGGTTSTATARIDEEGSPSYDFAITWDLPPQRLPDGTGLHVGSLGTVLEPGRAPVLDLVGQAVDRDLFVSYDPNIRPALLDDPAGQWPAVRELASCCRLVKVSDQDLAALRPEQSVHGIASELLAAERTELVVVTRGPRGALAFTENDDVEVPSPPTPVVDTVGAGDAFMAALLAILAGWELLPLGSGGLSALDRHRLRALLTGACLAASVTVSRRGANPPTRRELPPAWPAGA